MNLTLLGTGTATPRASIEQHAAAAMAQSRCCDTARQSRLLRTIYRMATVRRRGSVVLNDDAPTATFDGYYADRNGHGHEGPPVGHRMRTYVEEAPRLSMQAAGAALAGAGESPADVSQLVVVSCTGFSAPGLDAHLIDGLGLPSTVERTTIGFMGCHGAINGLRVAHALAAQRPGERVLLCAVELCSLHFQSGWNSQQVVANSLFADGAAAVVATAGDGGEPQDLPRLTTTGSRVFPGSREDMTWTIDDHGFRMTLSPRVPGLIRRHLPDWLGSWLGEHGLTPADVGSWAVHPGGPRILDAVEEAMELQPTALAASRAVLEEHGNMSSPTVLFILERLLRQDAPRPVVLLAFGPGLAAEAAVIF